MNDSFNEAMKRFRSLRAEYMAMSHAERESEAGVLVFGKLKSTDTYLRAIDNNLSEVLERQRKIDVYYKRMLSAPWDIKNLISLVQFVLSKPVYTLAQSETE